MNGDRRSRDATLSMHALSPEETRRARRKELVSTALCWFALGLLVAPLFWLYVVTP